MLENQGEFKVGMYAKVIDKNDPNYNNVGLVTEVKDISDYDELTVKFVDNSVSVIKSTVCKIVLSREYATDLLSSIGNDKSELEKSTNEDLLSNICLSGFVHDDLIDSVFNDVEFKRDDKIDDILKVSGGKFKPKKKFLGFVSALRGTNLRIISNKAKITGSQLSGMLDDVEFEMSVYQDGTIDFIELGDKNLSDENMIKRIIDDICERKVVGYNGKFVISDFAFSVVKDHDPSKSYIDVSDNLKCYLEVEYQKPIDKLNSLFVDDGEKNVSDSALSIIDSLLLEEPENQSSEVVDQTELTLDQDPIKEEPKVDFLAEQFRIMNESRVLELKERIERQESEIRKVSFEMSTSEKKLNNLKVDLGVLNTRLESMTPPSDPIGSLFFVSEKKPTSLDKTPEVESLMDRISEVFKIPSDKLSKIIQDGYFVIKLKLKDDSIDIKNIHKKLLSIPGSFRPVSDLEFEYRGDLNWHQLVSKMIRMGFEQSDEFDKESGSNSYTSIEYGIENKIEKDSEINSVEDSTNEDKTPVESGEKIVLASFNSPTDIVVFGDDLCDFSKVEVDFDVDDDETGFSLKVNGKYKTINSMGFGSIMTLSQYQLFLDKIKVNSNNPYMGSDYFEMSGLIGGYVIFDFVGDVYLYGEDDNGNIICDLDKDDFLWHQNKYMERIVVDLNGDFKIAEINDDWML